MLADLRSLLQVEAHDFGNDLFPRRRPEQGRLLAVRRAADAGACSPPVVAVLQRQLPRQLARLKVAEPQRVTADSCLLHDHVTPPGRVADPLDAVFELV